LFEVPGANMSQRFIRCQHCGLPHDETQTFCPSTGLAIRRDKSMNMPAAPAVAAPPPEPSPPARKAAHHSPPSTPPQRQQQRDLFGKTIGGKYVVRSVLGEGGMGTVFEAEHITIGRSVAVKVLHPNQARKKDAVRRFHQEARAAGAIGHPNICEVYDLGTLDDGSPYLVMEKLTGETLADRIAAEGGLPFDDVIDILVQVLSGLVAAHEKGIVHRDIKPENVFLTKRVGCPPLCKLLDFGVSKVIGSLIGGKDDDLELTRTGMVMGTPYYMSPEQARGDRNLDARVDLYACGVILYEALTGRRPFTAANYNALLLQILSTKPKAAREFRPALPAGFDAVLDKAMARSRDDRYRSAAEFQRDLQTLRDKHNTGSSNVLADAMRALEAAPAPPAPAPAPRRAPAPQAQAQAPRPGAPPPKRERQPTPSSVEIPIVVSGDTPLSGENIPVEATEMESRPPPARQSRHDISEFEEYPTQVQASPFDVAHASSKRPPARPRADSRPGVADTDVTGKPAAANDTDPTGRLQATPAPAPRRSSPDLREDQDTIVRSNALPLPKRRQPRRSSPDDTLRVDSETSGEGDPTLLMPPRAPKAPRR
jgi:eukaryotic-like serine/threonine-protein kinase